MARNSKKATKKIAKRKSPSKRRRQIKVEEQNTLGVLDGAMKNTFRAAFLKRQ